MNFALVIGRVWCGAHVPQLKGATLLIVEELDALGRRTGKTAVSLDTLGAGAGERVFTVAGSSARLTEGGQSRPVDLAVIGIIDP